RRHGARPPALANRRPAPERARRDRDPHRGREARGAERAPGDRRPQRALGALGRRAGRRSGPRDPRGARAVERRLRGAVRLPLRRVRQPPPEGGDSRSAAHADRQPARAGAGHSRGRAVRDRGGPMAQLLASYTTDWLDLVFRWFHVTAAIVWIGTSFYFV